MKDGYGEAVVIASSLAESLQPQIERCVRDVLSRIPASATTFCFCDFASADGKNSSKTARTVAAQVKRAGGPQEVSVVLEDQEQNDFRPAFANVTKALQDVDVDVFVSSVGRTFFSQCLPKNSLHFGTSTFAMFFLDTTTAPQAGVQVGYPFELLYRLVQAKGNVSALSDSDRAQLEAVGKKSAMDWQQFLLCRAKELCVGGRLLVVSLGSVPFSDEEHGPFFRNAHEELELVVEAVHDMIMEGEIGRDEADNFLYCAHYHTLEEIKAPFLSDSSPVRQAGLKLIRAENFLLRHPNAIQSYETLSDDEIKRLAAADCQAIQSYFWPPVQRGFAAKAGRSEQEANRLADLVFQRVEKEMVKRRLINVGNAMFLAEVVKEV